MNNLFEIFQQLKEVNPYAAGAFIGAKVTSLKGTTGYVTHIHYEHLRQDRYDSITIEWDNGSVSAYVFLDNILLDNQCKFIVNIDRLNYFKQNMQEPPSSAIGVSARFFKLPIKE